MYNQQKIPFQIQLCMSSIGKRGAYIFPDAQSYFVCTLLNTVQIKIGMRIFYENHEKIRSIYVADIFPKLSKYIVYVHVAFADFVLLVGLEMNFTSSQNVQNTVIYGALMLKSIPGQGLLVLSLFSCLVPGIRNK